MAKQQHRFLLRLRRSSSSICVLVAVVVVVVSGLVCSLLVLQASNGATGTRTTTADAVAYGTLRSLNVKNSEKNDSSNISNNRARREAAIAASATGIDVVSAQQQQQRSRGLSGGGGPEDTIRINCGQRLAYTDSHAIAWQGDQYYNAGYALSNPFGVFFQKDGRLYQTYRRTIGFFGLSPPLRYTIPVSAAATYNVELIFTQSAFRFLTFNGNNADVYIQNALAFSSLAIKVGGAGAPTPGTMRVRATATTTTAASTITIEIRRGSPALAAISIAKAQSTQEGPVQAPTITAPTTKAPTRAPVSAPTTKAPTRAPVSAPTTKAPTRAPVTAPTTKAPTRAPVTAPTTKAPTRAPVTAPNTKAPTGAPSRTCTIPQVRENLLFLV
jgi:Malectin domain